MSSHILGEVDLLATGSASSIGAAWSRNSTARPWSGGATGDWRSRRGISGGRDRLAGGRPDAAAARRRATRTPRPDGPGGAGEGRGDPLCAAGAPPTHLAIARESLEEHFMRLTSDEAGAA